MSSKLLIKRSAVPSQAPTTAQLDLGELAINTYDGKLYLKKDNGTPSIVEIGSGAGGGSGDVVGPSSSVDNIIPVFDGTTGKLLKSSPASATKTISAPDGSGRVTTQLKLNLIDPTPLSENTRSDVRFNLEPAPISDGSITASYNVGGSITDNLSTASNSGYIEQQFGIETFDNDTIASASIYSNTSASGFTSLSAISNPYTIVQSPDGSTLEIGTSIGADLTTAIIDSYVDSYDSLTEQSVMHKVLMTATETTTSVGSIGSPLDIQVEESTKFSVTTDGEFTIGPSRNPGSAGQVLTSGGAGQPVTWSTISSGGSGDMLKSVYDTDNDGVVDAAESVPWAGVTNKPSTFTPSAHTHVITDVTGLQDALNGKQAAGNYEPAITKTTGYAKWTGSAWSFVNETYLQSYTETDPVFTASQAFSITAQNKTDWSTAFSWGNHATAGYLTTSAAALAYQPLDADLTAWAAVSPSSKQDTLVSGTNIKTINSQSILGSGNITISGAGLGDVTGPSSSTANHLATFADTTGKVIKEASYFDSPAVAIPSAPASGDLRWFARSRGGRILPHVIGPSGVDVALQPALFGNTIYMWLPGTGTTTSINFGTNFTARNSGTSAAQAHPTKASTNAMTSLNRATFGTGTTATGASGIQSGATVAWRGNAANLGGFFFYARFGIETLASDMRAFVGLSANNATMSADPSTWNNTVGICKDTGDSVWQILTRGTAATKTSTGATVTAGQILDMFMFAPPNGSNITFRLVNAVNGTVYVDDVAVTATLPSATTFMYMQAHTQSVTGTTAKLLALNRMYCEVDL